jgi:hypothetical protein|tara:strand:- start:497 stop:670 length:174 start_codon:yes stop_codon:yes gene_type:complete
MSEKQVIIQEKPYTIEVGHDRYQNLIIKKLRVSGDDLEEVITQLKEALAQFEVLKNE